MPAGGDLAVLFALGDAWESAVRAQTVWHACRLGEQGGSRASTQNAAENAASLDAQRAALRWGWLLPQSPRLVPPGNCLNRYHVISFGPVLDNCDQYVCDHWALNFPSQGLGLLICETRLDNSRDFWH